MEVEDLDVHGGVRTDVEGRVDVGALDKVALLKRGKAVVFWGWTGHGGRCGKRSFLGSCPACHFGNDIEYCNDFRKNFINGDCISKSVVIPLEGLLRDA